MRCLAPDAARRWAVGQSFPEQVIFRRCRQDRIALSAIAPVEFGLCEQGPDLWLAARGQQRQSIERTSQGALLDEFAAALAEPTRQLQARIIECAHKGEALPWCAFRGSEQYAGQWAELAGQGLFCSLDLGWTKRGRAGNDLSRRVGEAYNFSARAIDSGKVRRRRARRTPEYPCVRCRRHGGGWRRRRGHPRLRELKGRRQGTAARY